MENVDQQAIGTTSGGLSSDIPEESTFIIAGVDSLGSTAQKAEKSTTGPAANSEVSGLYNSNSGLGIDWVQSRGDTSVENRHGLGRTSPVVGTCAVPSVRPETPAVDTTKDDEIQSEIRRHEGTLEKLRAKYKGIRGRYK